MTTVTVSAKGWIVIPKEIRERHDIRKGDKIHVIDFGGVIRIIPAAKGDPIERGYGMFKDGPSLTKGLLEDRRWELEQEERDLPPPRPRE
jgi:AbrB family looped-hinge helix DNA binding protein